MDNTDYKLAWDTLDDIIQGLKRARKLVPAIVSDDKLSYDEVIALMQEIKARCARYMPPRDINGNFKEEEK